MIDTVEDACKLTLSASMVVESVITALTQNTDKGRCGGERMLALVGLFHLALS